VGRLAPPAEQPPVGLVKKSGDVGQLGVALLVHAFAQTVGNTGF
jgi:hypothetical protein